MYTVGLTGGIGSGKSLVARIFTHLGIPVFNADSESKKILDDDPYIRQKLTDWFGPEIYQDNKVDRPKLAGIIFTSPAMLSKVNGLVHPRVLERFKNWCIENQDKPYVIHEAAILIESGFFKQMDATILVTAPESIRMARVRARDKDTEESVRQRMQNQWTDEQKSPFAGYTIQNDERTALLPAILEIHNKLIG